MARITAYKLGWYFKTRIEDRTARGACNWIHGKIRSLPFTEVKNKNNFSMFTTSTTRFGLSVSFLVRERGLLRRHVFKKRQLLLHKPKAKHWTSFVE